MIRNSGRQFRFSVAALLMVSVTACASVLGLKEAREDDESLAGAGRDSTRGGGSSAGRAAAGGLRGSDGGADTQGGVPGDGGTPNENGGELGRGGSGESGASAGRGGATGGVANSGGNGPGGSPGTAGSAGAIEEGGSSSTEGSTVHGRVVDFLGHGVSGAVVAIGDAETATNARGEFTIDEAPTEYDVSVTFSVPVLARIEDYIWVYQGLRRRNPTIQVYRGVELQFGDMNYTYPDPVLDDTHRTQLAIGTPDGAATVGINSADGKASAAWYGPTATSGKAHILHWQRDSQGLPVAYEAYGEQPIALTSESGTATPITIGFSTSPVPANPISGSVSTTATASITRALYARFASTALFTLLREDSNADNFAFLAPSLPNAVITVAAYYGAADFGEPYSAAHKDVAPGQANIELSLPTPAVLSAPMPSASGVNTATQFRWVSDAKVFVLHVEDAEKFRDLFVVTSQKQITLPVVAGGSPLRAGAPHIWSVQVHGDWSSVDAAAGPNGFQDPFGVWPSSDPDGNARGDGSFSQSEKHEFTAAASL